MIKSKKDLAILIGILLIFVGALLPSIRIAQENISFIKDNSPLMLFIALIMFILLKLEKREYIIIPSAISLSFIIKFVLDNIDRLSKIRIDYNCYAQYQYGLIVMVVGNIIILLSIYIPYISLDKIKVFAGNFVMFFKKLFSKIKLSFNKICSMFKEKKVQYKLKKRYAEQEKMMASKNKKLLTPAFIEKMSKKENKFSRETTKDGKIKYNKIVVKVDKKVSNKSFKEKFEDLILRLKIKKVLRKKISISKYRDDKTKKYYIPTIDIKRWTRNSVCCVNCGATVNSNSEYCFLCDCKIKFNDKEKKIS